eukprot:2667229-Prymnesium_polylepis.2
MGRANWADARADQRLGGHGRGHGSAPRFGCSTPPEDEGARGGLVVQLARECGHLALEARVDVVVARLWRSSGRGPPVRVWGA